MKFKLFTQVALREDIPQYGLTKGNVGTIVEYYPMSQGKEDGYSLEGLIEGDTLEVSESQIEFPKQEDILIEERGRIRTDSPLSI